MVYLYNNIYYNLIQIIFKINNILRVLEQFYLAIFILLYVIQIYKARIYIYT